MTAVVYGVALGRGVRHGTRIHRAEATDYRINGLTGELSEWARWWCGGHTYNPEFGDVAAFEGVGYERCRLCFGPES